MKRVEKLILVLIAFLVVSRIGIFLKDIFYASYVGADGPTLQQTALFKNISIILYSLVNIGSSIWLYIESKKAELNEWIWTLFGLCSGLMAVAMFYLNAIYYRIRFVEKDRQG